MLEKKNKDSFGIYIKFCTKRRIPIFDLQLLFFSPEKKIENRDSMFC